MGLRAQFLLSVVLASCLLSVCLAVTCPLSCSNHGICDQNTGLCSCDVNYAGDDCSIYDLELQNGQVKAGSAGTRAWAYYHISANSDRGDLKIEVNQTGSGGDCDTYVRLGAYPDRKTYDFRDITTSNNVKIEVPHPHGLYYIGIYGFLGCDFNIRATIKTDCPNDCSGHGSCGAGGVCVCSTGYIGDDCSMAIVSMNDKQVYNGATDAHTWKYYVYENMHNTLVISMNQTAASTDDCDLYVRLGDMPALATWDYRDTSLSTKLTMRIADASRGDYYIGVYGFKACHYAISAESHDECPNNCSGDTHGSCSKSTTTCRCSARFSGLACETMIPAMAFDQPNTGLVNDNMWNWYHFQTYTSSNVAVNLVQEESNMDCDLYIKRGSEPTRSSYDYRDTSFRQNMTITIEDPAQAVYYIGVYGYHTCAYTLKTHLTVNCPNGCTDPSKGTCVDSHCECKDGWTGDDCSVADNLLDNGVTEKSNIAMGQWEYWQFNAKGGLSVNIVMKELNSTGFVWLYVSQQGFPTLSVYDAADVETNTATHGLHIRPTNDGAVTIGIFGSSFAIPEALYAYDVSAWQADFRMTMRKVKLEDIKA